MNPELGVQIDAYLMNLFAHEDEALEMALQNAKEHGLPAIHVSAVQGKALHVLARLVRARTILEIGSLGGYSGIWLARALPPDGSLISLELEQKHAELTQQAYQRAGVADRAEVRVGPALQTLPVLEHERRTFDLVFIDADKEGYPAYLEWALKLTKPGSVIIGDNTIRNGTMFDSNDNSSGTVALRRFNQMMADHPRLSSIAFPIIKHGVDGMTVGVVLG